MKIVLLIGALVNAIGGMSILLSMYAVYPFSFPKLPAKDDIRPDDYILYRLFTAGTAFCFASMYLYLYFRPEFAFPFLLFGMALKYWAFAASLVAWRKFRLPFLVFLNFGIMNLFVAVLFSGYLLLR